MHDAAAGLFPGAALGAWAIRLASESASAGTAIVTYASGRLWLVLFFSLSSSAGTGLFRLRYWRLTVRQGYLETQAEIAALRHSLFVMMMLSAVAMWRVISGSRGCSTGQRQALALGMSFTGMSAQMMWLAMAVFLPWGLLGRVLPWRQGG